MKKLFAVHPTFDKETTGGDPVYFVATTVGVTKLSGTKLAKWIASLKPGDTLRITTLGQFQGIAIQLHEQGVKLLTCHWHKTGIKKGLDPEQIAEQFFALPADTFTQFKPRKDLNTLKSMVQARAVVMDMRKRANQRLQIIARGMGLTDDDTRPEYLRIQEEGVDDFSKEMESPIDKDITALARTVPECVALNAVLDVKTAWITAATVVGLLGDIRRFHSIHALWHYCGYHVIDGKAPKRAKGVVMSYNPKVRTALWLWADSMVKGKSRWRAVYDSFRSAEIVTHLMKHPECKNPEGHSGARARRKVVKEVLKEFFLKINGAYAVEDKVQRRKAVA